MSNTAGSIAKEACDHDVIAEAAQDAYAQYGNCVSELSVFRDGRLMTDKRVGWTLHNVRVV